MDVSNTPNVTPPATPEAGAPASPSTKVLGVERRLIGFGFGLLLVLVVLAVIYSQFTRQPMPTAVDTDVPAMRSEQPMNTGAPAAGAPSAAQAPITGAVTPDRVADDLIDEALADRDDLSNYDSDEMADVEEGNNN